MFHFIAVLLANATLSALFLLSPPVTIQSQLTIVTNNGALTITSYSGIGIDVAT